MSSITLVSGFVPTKSVAPQPALRLTRRGRVVLVLLFTAALMALMIVRGGFAVATLSAGSPGPVRVIQIQPGDTLYRIAGQLAAPGEVREMDLCIQELNSLPDDGSLQVGTQLAVPKG